MKPYVTCILGMMVGTLVLLCTALYKPHDFTHFEAGFEKNTQQS